MAGSELTMPVQAMVIILGFSMVPQDTMTAGTGASRAPGFQVTLLIMINSFADKNMSVFVS